MKDITINCPAKPIKALSRMTETPDGIRYYLRSVFVGPDYAEASNGHVAGRYYWTEADQVQVPDSGACIRFSRAMITPPKNGEPRFNVTATSDQIQADHCQGDCDWQLVQATTGNKDAGKCWVIEGGIFDKDWRKDTGIVRILKGSDLNNEGIVPPLASDLLAYTSQAFKDLETGSGFKPVHFFPPANKEDSTFMFSGQLMVIAMGVMGDKESIARDRTRKLVGRPSKPGRRAA